jgi:hypothetical protein
MTEEEFFASLGPSQPKTPPPRGVLVFEHPTNRYRETVRNPGGWCLLFGCFYLVSKGAWAHAVAAFFAAWFTFGASWIVYPFFAERIVTTAYLRNGWRLVSPAPSLPTAPTVRNPANWRRDGPPMKRAIIAILIGIAILGAMKAGGFRPPEPPAPAIKTAAEKAEDDRDAKCSGLILATELVGGEHLGMFAMAREIKKLKMIGAC